MLVVSLFCFSHKYVKRIESKNKTPLTETHKILHDKKITVKMHWTIYLFVPAEPNRKKQTSDSKFITEFIRMMAFFIHLHNEFVSLARFYVVIIWMRSLSKTVTTLSDEWALLKGKWILFAFPEKVRK